jgi:anti-sigma factor (TIGR02949 family)
MVCDDVQRVVYFFLDGELTESQARNLGDHFSLCPNCEERLLIQQRLRIFIRKRLPQRPAPVSLRDRIAAAVHVPRVER